MKTFLALFMGSPGRAPGPGDMSPEDMQRGMAAWGAWMETHAASIVDPAGPVGVTKCVSQRGVEDIRNQVGGYVVVRAGSLEAAARMFEGHPHFTIFPGDRVEIMERLPAPGA